MKRIEFASIVLLAGLLFSSTPLLAHHGYAAYDMTTTRTLKGTITNFNLANPHSQIAFDVKDDKGNVEHWVVECAAPVRSMKQIGFDFDTLRPGDVATITFNPGKNTAHVGVMFSVEFSDGRVIKESDRRR
jgi:hypothetical protein